MTALDPLSALISLSGDVGSLLSKARVHCQEPAGHVRDSRIQLRVGDISEALERVERGELTVDELQQWAGFLEMNELIEYEPKRESDIADALFRLATPEINEPITLESVQRVRRRLEVNP